MTQISTHLKMVDEILLSVSESEDTIGSLKAAMGNNSYLHYYMNIASNGEWAEFDIDSIVPVDYGYHRSMAGARLLNKSTVKIVTELIMESSSLVRVKVKQYKALYEMLCAEEAAIFKAALKKDIASIYPKLTHEVICSAMVLYYEEENV